MRKACSTAERSKSVDKYEIELGRYKTRIFALLATEASGLPGIKSEECANCDHRCSLEIGCYCFNYGCGKGKTTSSKVASKASKVLSDGRYSKTSKSVAGSALAQAKGK